MDIIEIDFDVFKKLTAMRESQSTTYNDVLRRMLGLNALKTTAPSSQPNDKADSWTTKGVTFPVGTEFRASYKGEWVYGKVESNALAVNGKRFFSPSSAAVNITGNPVNGWVFWECKYPGKSSWQMLKSLRKEA